jgi:hypothetical protein
MSAFGILQCSGKKAVDSAPTTPESGSDSAVPNDSLYFRVFIGSSNATLLS